MLASSCSFDTAMNPPPPQNQQQPQSEAEVAEKVLRRIEIGKVARNLQDCLAFASFKAQNGWQDRTLSSIEPEITEKLMRRKRVFADNDTTDYPTMIDESFGGSRKRVRAVSVSASRQSNVPSWKQDHQLPQSSPIDHNSFEPSYPTLHDSPMFDAPSINEDEKEDEDDNLPMQEPSSSVISSSPPRTPPSTRRMPASSKQAGADLLLYLANSPRSPKVHVTHISSAQKEIPSTPPSRHAHLSATMHTPGMFNGTLQTPGQNFNFADFCNVTPSPGHAAWGGRTPAMSKTPARLARRGLTFDAPASDGHRHVSTTQGLALQLGGELVPRS